MFSQGRSMSETNVKAQEVKFWKVSRTKNVVVWALRFRFLFEIQML